MTEYVVAQWLKLTGNSPFTVTAIGPPLLVALLLPTAPPVSPSRTSYPLSYGIAIRGPSHTAQPQTFSAQNPQPTLSLAAGETGAYNVAIENTGTHLDYYFDLPVGLNLVKVENTGLGITVDTQNWVTSDSANPRRYIYSIARRGDSIYHTRITVRRP